MGSNESQSCPKTFSNIENKSDSSNDENAEGLSLSNAIQLERCSSISDEFFDNFDLWSMHLFENQSCPNTLSKNENKSEFSNDEIVKGGSHSDANQLQCSSVSEIYNNFDFCANKNSENICLESEHGTSQVFSKNDLNFSNMSTLNTDSSVKPDSRFSHQQQENAFEISSSSSNVSVPSCTTTNPSSSTSIFVSDSHSKVLKSTTSNICEYMVDLFISTLCVQKELGSSSSIAANTSEENRATNVARTGDASVNDDNCMPESFQASEEREALYQTNMPVITDTVDCNISNELSEDSMQGILLDEEPPIEISSGPQAPDNRNNSFGTSEKSLDGKYSIAGPSSKTADVRWRLVDGRFICSRYGKGFGWKRSVVDHYRSHTGEKHFACDKCEKRFNFACSLSRHRKTHTGEKPFACDKCEKRFNLAGNLARHRKTHTGQKPFKCDKCVKRFGDASNLRRHRRTHTDDKLYKCLICEKAFTRNYNRNKHCKNVHNII